jgi:hypothetical protein
MLLFINHLTGTIVSSTSELKEAIRGITSSKGKEILLKDGIYEVDGMIWIGKDDITIRSQSGNRDAVIIRGQGMYGGTTHIFNVWGTNFSVKDMTIGWVANHAIQIHGNNNSSNTVISNLRIVDTYEQMVKISYNSSSSNSSTNGLMENCLLEYTAGIGPQFYIGGIDGHQTVNWVVRNNVFKNIISPEEDLAEHAIHFWSGSSGTIVENNIIINCDRGIGFGLGSRGHTGGIIRNNFIYHDTHHDLTGDVAIGLENASGAWVYNNTIYMENSYSNAIEYRFPGTSGGLIANNLTNKLITSRDGGTADVYSNFTSAISGWFVEPDTGNLHLDYEVPEVVDHGSIISGLDSDIDGDPRPWGGGIDLGADEYTSIAASITVLSPNGGEDWPIGTYKSIIWDYAGTSYPLKISLWRDGLQVGIIASDINPLLGSYTWITGRYLGGIALPGSGYSIKIKARGVSVWDRSDNNFSVLPQPVITIVSPNGGEDLTIGSSMDIIWDSSGLTNPLKITLWRDNQLLGAIGNNIDPSNSSFSWTVGQYGGGMAAAGTGYKIKVKEKYSIVQDLSDNSFSLSQ